LPQFQEKLPGRFEGFCLAAAEILAMAGTLTEDPRNPAEFFLRKFQSSNPTTELVSIWVNRATIRVAAY
jgi:hypothetical protein